MNKNSLFLCNELFKESSQDYIKGEYDKALETLNKILTTLEEDHSEEKENAREILELKLQIYSLICETLEILGDNEKKSVFLKKIENDTHGTELEKEGRIKYLIFSVKINMIKGEFDEAINKSEELLVLCGDDSKKNRDKAITYQILGNCLIVKGNLSEAEENMKKSIDLLQEGSDPIQLSSAINCMGKLFIKKGNHEKAAVYFKEALEIRRSIGNKFLIFQLLNNLGVCSYLKGELDEALAFYTESYEISKELGNQNLIATPLNNMGQVYADMGKFKTALNYLNQSLTINTSLGNPINIAKNYGILGIINRWLRELDRSVEMLKKGMDVLESINDKIAISMLKIELVFTYSDARNFSEAKKILKELFNIKNEIQQLNLDAYYEYSEGYYLKAINKNKEALESFRKSRKITKEINLMDYYIFNGLKIAETLTNIYQVTKDENLLEESEILIEEITQAAVKNNMRVVLIEALILKGKIKLVQKKNASAREIFALADMKAKSFGFIKATKEINEVKFPRKKTYSKKNLKDQKKTRDEITELLTAEEIQRSMLESVLNLSIPWSSKESIFFTCTNDFNFLKSILSDWKEKELISVDDFNFLDLIIIEKETVIHH